MEVPIARRNLLADKVKLAVALGGVTLAILLIVVLQSLYAGVDREAAAFVRSLPGDAWVAQEGTGGLVFTNSVLPESAATVIEAVPGVATVHQLYGRLMNFEVDGHTVRTYVISLAPGGTLTPEQKRLLPETGTIVVDRAFAGRTGLSVGDVLDYRGSALTVADVRRVGNLFVTQFAFIHPEDYRRLLGIRDFTNFFLVSFGPGASDVTLEEIERRVEGSSVLTTDEVAELFQQSMEDFRDLVGVVTVVSFIVGLAVLSLTIYSATIERAREYGIMKVLGASPLRLYRIVFSQSTVIAMLGFSAGLGLAFLFNRVAGDVVPQFVTYVRWQDVAFVLGLSALMTFLASFLPINRIARVNPASVFRP